MNLLSCPFCNGNAIQVIGNRNSYNYVAFIQCTKCEAQGEKFEDKLDEVAKEKSTTAWNNRPSKWISVKESLPDSDRLVFVLFSYHDFGVPQRSSAIGYYSVRTGWELFCPTIYVPEILAWMNRPKLPEDK